jgi:hypothetical protein
MANSAELPATASSLVPGASGFRASREDLVPGASGFRASCGDLVPHASRRPLLFALGAWSASVLTGTMVR